MESRTERGCLLNPSKHSLRHPGGRPVCFWCVASWSSLDTLSICVSWHVHFRLNFKERSMKSTMSTKNRQGDGRMGVAGGPSRLPSGVALTTTVLRMLKSRGRAGGGSEPLTSQSGIHLNKGKINILSFEVREWMAYKQILFSGYHIKTGRKVLPCLEYLVPGCFLKASF